MSYQSPQREHALKNTPGKKVKVGVEGLSFDAAHYTISSNGKCENLHGHTFFVSVEIEGQIDERTGMVMDFTELKRIVKETLSEFDHKLLLPSKDASFTTISGNFNVSIKYLEYPHATTEYIALSILKELKLKIPYKVKLRIYEGKNNYVEVESE